jgi:hypothetical protein
LRAKTTMVLAAFISFFIAIYLAGLTIFQIDTAIMGTPLVTWAIVFFIVGLVILISLLIIHII